MPRLTALGGIVAISFSAILVRLADVAPATAGLFRALYALPLLLVLTRILGDQRDRRARMLAFASGLLLAGDIALWHTSIALIGAGLSTVLANTQVVWVAIAAWLVLRERLTPTAFVVVPIILIGVTLIGGVGSDDAYGSNPALGAVLGVGAGMFYAAFLLVYRRAAGDGTAPAGPMLDVTAGIAVAFLIGGWLDPGFSIAPDLPAHWWLVALGTLVHGCGWLLLSIALPRLPVLDTSIMLLLQPALTIVWGWIIFAERMSNPQWVGVGLVLVGIAAAAARGTVRPQEAETRPDL